MPGPASAAFAKSETLKRGPVLERAVKRPLFPLRHPGEERRPVGAARSRVPVLPMRTPWEGQNG